jgi:hypothetical protein
MWLASLRRRRCLIFLLICFFVSSSPIRAQDVKLSLSQIPHREQVLLEELFSFFIQWEQLSHVLFFETKPACFTGIPINCNHSITPPCISKDPLKFQDELCEGWNIWKKYEHLFNHPNFIISEEIRQIEKGEKHGTMIDVFFINKKSFLNCLEQYADIFKKELGEGFYPEGFLKEVEEKKMLRSLIKHDEMLLGLLLGYGYEASSAFKEEKLGHITDILTKPIGKKLKGCKFAPVSFKGNPLSKESQNLTDKYSDELNQIWNTYQDRNLLEVTLGKLCSEYFQ